MAASRGLPHPSSSACTFTHFSRFDVVPCPRSSATSTYDCAGWRWANKGCSKCTPRALRIPFHSTLMFTHNDTPQTARHLDSVEHLLTPRSRPRRACLEKDSACPGRVARKGEERTNTNREQTHSADDASDGGRREICIVATARGVYGQHDGEAAAGGLRRSGDLLARCDRSLTSLQHRRDARTLTVTRYDRYVSYIAREVGGADHLDHLTIGWKGLQSDDHCAADRRRACHHDGRYVACSLNDDSDTSGCVKRSVNDHRSADDCDGRNVASKHPLCADAHRTVNRGRCHTGWGGSGRLCRSDRRDRDRLRRGGLRRRGGGSGGRGSGCRCGGLCGDRDYSA